MNWNAVSQERWQEGKRELEFDKINDYNSIQRNELVEFWNCQCQIENWFIESYWVHKKVSNNHELTKETFGHPKNYISLL